MEVCGKINLLQLKKFVKENFPHSFVTRYIIENEKDALDCKDFVSKVDLWLKLIRWDLVKSVED